MRVGLVGYGTGGQHFHAPFIAAARGVELAGVVARAPRTVAKVEADLPGAPIFPSLAAMIEAGNIDASRSRRRLRPAANWCSKPLTPAYM
jgi:predicted dehydrogenase